MRLKFVSFLSLFLICSCRTFRGEFLQTGGQQEAALNAILDFSNTSRFHKKDSVFSVWVHDPLYRMVLEETDGSNAKWVEDKPYQGIVAVSIGASYDKILLTDSVKVGKKGVQIPTRFLEKDGNLFYWWDDDYPLTQEALDIFGKYGLLQDDEGGWVIFPDFSINDAQKGVDYYFCKNDLSRYKKIVTNKGIGFYEAPSVNCE